MTENYIRDYMRLAYQEAVNVQRLFVDAMSQGTALGSPGCFSTQRQYNE